MKNENNNNAAPVRTVLRRPEDRPPMVVPSVLAPLLAQLADHGVRQDERRHAVAHEWLNRTKGWRRQPLGVGLPR